MNLDPQEALVACACMKQAEKVACTSERQLSRYLVTLSFHKWYCRCLLDFIIDYFTAMTMRWASILLYAYQYSTPCKHSWSGHAVMTKSRWSNRIVNATHPAESLASCLRIIQLTIEWFKLIVNGITISSILDCTLADKISTSVVQSRQIKPCETQMSTLVVQNYQDYQDWNMQSRKSLLWWDGMVTS